MDTRLVDRFKDMCEELGGYFNGTEENRYLVCDIGDQDFHIYVEDFKKFVERNLSNNEGIVLQGGNYEDDMDYTKRQLIIGKKNGEIIAEYDYEESRNVSDPESELWYGLGDDEEIEEAVEEVNSQIKPTLNLVKNRYGYDDVDCHLEYDDYSGDVGLTCELKQRFLNPNDSYVFDLEGKTIGLVTDITRQMLEEFEKELE